MVDALSRRLVPDTLWEIVEPTLPRFRARPQGGGRAALDDRAVFTALVYVLTSGCAWRQLPPSLGVSVPTAHRRFTTWVQEGVFDELHRHALDRLGVGDDLDWSAAILEAAHVRARWGPSDRTQLGRPSRAQRDPHPLRRRRHPTRHACDPDEHP
ncbi:transposase [Rhodococcus sp. 14C212]|nr:transposase [Rhodococcus sp. 14C212]